jgi:hypothetical protein
MSLVNYRYRLKQDARGTSMIGDYTHLAAGMPLHAN